MNEDTSAKILKKLKEQQKEEGKLPLLLEFYQKLLRAQSAVRKSITGPGAIPGSEEIQTRLAEGKPLITFDELIIDWELLRKFFVEVIGIFARYTELFGELPDSLKKPEARTLLTEEAVKNWFTGNALPAALTADISPTLIQMIVQSAVYPFLTKHVQALKDAWKKELKDEWRREYCPFCGGSPDMAYLEPEVGARCLVCSRCDSAWSYQRLQCPY